MRKIVSNLFMTLDGVVEAPHKWSGAYWSDEIAEVMTEVTDSSDALLIGRVTYGGFAEAWSGRTMEDDPGADFFNSVRKHVASTTLDEVTWTNSTLIEGDVVAGVAALKEEEGGDIMTSGSGTLVRSLLQAGLVDELRLLVYPVIVGAGKRLCEGEEEEIPLSFLHSRTFENGVTYAVYGPPASGTA